MAEVKGSQQVVTGTVESMGSELLMPSSMDVASAYVWVSPRAPIEASIGFAADPLTVRIFAAAELQYGKDNSEL